MKFKVFISTVPFGEMNGLPIDFLNAANIEFVINPLGRKLTSKELAELIPGYDALIAGTEDINKEVFEAADRLKLISRVGIGLDSVDLIEAAKRGIEVSYTPAAPAPAVAELTIGLMLNCLRRISEADASIKRGNWNRLFGRRIPEIAIGIIGVGRIGGRVLRRLSAFGSPRILVNDLNPSNDIAPDLKLEWVSKETIYSEADLISLHLPLTRQTAGLIGAAELSTMKPDAILINTSRGGIIDEAALYAGLQEGRFSSVAIDVFEREPYVGNLTEFDRCILTAHMGSMSVDCRSNMEIEATKEVVRFFQNEPRRSPVPEAEYLIQKASTLAL